MDHVLASEGAQSLGLRMRALCCNLVKLYPVGASACNERADVSHSTVRKRTTVGGGMVQIDTKSAASDDGS